MQSWQELAKKIRIGEKRKVEHCVKGSPSAYISQNAHGVRLHCFRCGTKEFSHHVKLSLTDVLAMRRLTDEATTKPLPAGVALGHSSVPEWAQTWVLRAGLSPELASGEYGFRWIPQLERVGAPVLQDAEDTGLWFARAGSGVAPKYIMPRGSSGSLWYDVRREYSAIVVTEDVLSAIKVTRAGFNGVAILGTSPVRGIGLLARGRAVAAWLDPDRAGVKGYVKLRKALAPLGIDPVRITSEKDPKLYSVHQVREILKGLT